MAVQVRCLACNAVFDLPRKLNTTKQMEEWYCCSRCGNKTFVQKLPNDTYDTENVPRNILIGCLLGLILGGVPGFIVGGFMGILFS